MGLPQPLLLMLIPFVRCLLSSHLRSLSLSSLSFARNDANYFCRKGTNEVTATEVALRDAL
jgi:hypothetical protein